MAIRTVDVHPLAEKEMRAAYRRYARLNPEAAVRFRAALDRVAERIATGAEQGAPFRLRYRWMRLRRFPYLLYYEIRDPLPVLVYAVAHSRRRLGYWLRRARP